MGLLKWIRNAFCCCCCCCRRKSEREEIQVSIEPTPGPPSILKKGRTSRRSRARVNFPADRVVCYLFGKEDPLTDSHLLGVAGAAEHHTLGRIDMTTRRQGIQVEFDEHPGRNFETTSRLLHKPLVVSSFSDSCLFSDQQDCPRSLLASRASSLPDKLVHPPPAVRREYISVSDSYLLQQRKKENRRQLEKTTSLPDRLYADSEPTIEATCLGSASTMSSMNIHMDSKEDDFYVDNIHGDQETANDSFLRRTSTMASLNLLKETAV